MKNFKKMICAALCLAMVFALCACGSQTNDKAKKTDENDNSRRNRASPCDGRLRLG